MKRKIVIGNWKMNKSICKSVEMVKEMLNEEYGMSRIQNTEIILTPSYLALSEVKRVCGSTACISLGAQDAYYIQSGNYCGAVSPRMLSEVCSYVFVGHSELRTHLENTDEIVNLKVKACIEEGMIPIFCVGESIEVQKAGKTYAHIRKQMQKGLDGCIPKEMIILYEPVWALGSGKVPAIAQVEEIMGKIADILSVMYGADLCCQIRSVYAGSVTPENARQYARLPHVDGVAVGTASLRTESFMKIIQEVEK